MDNLVKQCREADYEKIINRCRKLAVKHGLNLDAMVGFVPDFNKNYSYPEDVFAEFIFQILFWYEQGKDRINKERQKQGIIEAQKKGVKFGRPEKPVPVKFYELYREWKQGHITEDYAIYKLHVSRTTFYKWVKKYTEELESNT